MQKRSDFRELGQTRRSFVGSMQGLAMAGGTLPSLVNAASVGETPGSRESKPDGDRYRAVSWWLTWEDLTWPNEESMDKIRRRADQCVANGVNCCLIFGAHFRWDFMPMWDRLHDMLRFTADELHKRQIVLFDHHSSVLVHRPRNRAEALNIWQRNRHHVPFYPSLEAAATWEYNGSKLDDWRMLDAETGQPAYMPAYNAEQFCMNNPAFRESYQRYVKKLRVDTGIDGLMSDDAIYYAGWRSCSCKHCRERFQKTYGHRLPAVSDTSFWGNRRNQAFADWIDMRFQSSGDFLAELKKTLPAKHPFLTCCSSSDGYVLPAYGMSYQDFIQSCNLVLLEMAGSTPSTAGTWDDRVPSQLLHLGIARDYQVSCFGQGYGFFPDTAFFVWALNKFLGSDSWLSSLKGRLNASKAELDSLGDDPELVQEGYLWEKARPQLFKGNVDAEVAVLFSRATRDYYGQCAADYASDYQATCLELMRAGVSSDVVTEIPKAGSRRQLVLSSAMYLSAAERVALSQFMEGGGTVIATGPTGHYDQRARVVPKTWLQEFGVAVELTEPKRPGSFPPDKDLGPGAEIARCRVPDAFQGQMRDGWFTKAHGKGRLRWRPERITDQGVAAAVVAAVQSTDRPAIVVKGLPADWRVRQFRDGDRWLIHFIPSQVATVFHPTLRNHFSNERVISELRYTPLVGSLVLEPSGGLSRVVLHSPDLAETRPGTRGGGKTWNVDPAGVKRYFVLECFG